LNLAEIEIVSQTPYATVDRERKLQTSTFVVYKTEDRVAAIVIHKAKPSKEEIAKAIKDREAKR